MFVAKWKASLKALEMIQEQEREPSRRTKREMSTNDIVNATTRDIADSGGVRIMRERAMKKEMLREKKG